MINQDIMGVGDRHFTFQAEKLKAILSMQCRFGIEFDDLGSYWMCMIFVAMFTESLVMTQFSGGTQLKSLLIKLIVMLGLYR